MFAHLSIWCSVRTHQFRKRQNVQGDEDESKTEKMANCFFDRTNHLFVNHSDIAGGSTLGNILTSQIDIDGVDMGNALWAMHSAMETASIADQDYTIKAFTEFFNSEL